MILITGYKGFIGSHLFKVFKNTETIGIDLKDGEDINMMLPLDNIDLVYHLAAQTDVQESNKDPQQDAWNNIFGTLEIIRNYPSARIIYTGSAASNEIRSPYGLSKKTGAEYLKLLHKNHVICNLPNVYGGGKGVQERFKNEDPITVYGDGEQTRDFVHVDSIVEALLLAKDWPVGEYWLGSDKETKIIDLAKATGKKIIYEPALENEVRFSKVPNTTPNWHANENII